MLFPLSEKTHIEGRFLVYSMFQRLAAAPTIRAQGRPETDPQKTEEPKNIDPIPQDNKPIFFSTFLSLLSSSLPGEGWELTRHLQSWPRLQTQPHHCSRLTRTFPAKLKYGTCSAPVYLPMRICLPRFNVGFWFDAPEIRYLIAWPMVACLQEPQIWGSCPHPGLLRMSLIRHWPIEN